MDETHEFGREPRTTAEEAEQVGTVDVQILLSWFFETADPSDIAFDQLRRAA